MSRDVTAEICPTFVTGSNDSVRLERIVVVHLQQHLGHRWVRCRVLGDQLDLHVIGASFEVGAKRLGHSGWLAVKGETVYQSGTAFTREVVIVKAQSPQIVSTVHQTVLPKFHRLPPSLGRTLSSS